MFSSAIVLSTVIVLCTAYPLYEGTDCQLRNGAIGVCRSVKKCPGVLKTLKSGFGTPSSPVRCGWEGNTEIVCCGSKTTTPEQDYQYNDSIYFEWDHPTHYTTRRPYRPPRPTKPTKTAPPKLTKRISVQECDRFRRDMPITVDTHIIDGETAEQGSYPHMAALGYSVDDKIDYDCGGTLISERYIVTAAHCIRNKKKLKPTKVRLGTVNLEDNNFDRSDTDYDVEDTRIHPNYTTLSKYNDIALIKLSRPVTLSGNIYPACMYTGNDDPSGALTVMGWGTTNSKKMDSKSKILLKADLSAVPRAACNQEYVRGDGVTGYESIPDGITDGQICASDPESEVKLENRRKDTCNGDSGGPLQMAVNGIHTLVGITSFSFTECGSGAPGVYTRVSKYLDWIESEVWPSQEPDISFN